MDGLEYIMELICDTCHWPYVCDEEELEERCAECAVEKAIKRALEEGRKGDNNGD